MTTIKSLLSLQSESLEITEAVTALQDAIGRIKSMGVLYDKLYTTERYSDVSIKEYLSQLIDEIYRIFPKRQSIKIEKRIDDFIIGTSVIFPLGIILNELLSNALKHAFTDRETGLIQISVIKKNSHVKILFEDNGVGMPKLKNDEEQEDFGLMLIGLLTEQIDGGYRIERGNGTRFIIEFDL